MQHYASPDLPENIFPLILSDLPQQHHADPHGNLLFFSPTHGWMVASYEEAQDALTENLCTHWTFTPEHPSYALNYSH